MKRTITTALAMLSIMGAYAQSENKDGVNNMPLDWRKLNVNPYISFFIPYAEPKETSIPATINVEATYQVEKIANLRATLHLGSFTGLTIGGMYHLSDKVRNKKTRFIVAELKDKVYFYKGKADKQSIFGPAVDLKIGRYNETGFYTRVQGGLEWQTYSRSYYKGFNSAANGFTSVKIQALVANMNNADYVNGKEEYINRRG